MSGPSPALPVTTLTSDGRMRRLGVEIEFGGLSIDEAAETVRAEVGGEIRKLGRFEVEVTGDAHGPWGIELDAFLLKAWEQRQEGGNALAQRMDQLAEEAVRAAAEQIVPVEVVSPPLPMDQLVVVNRVIVRLGEAGARGTAERPTDAFGMQLNPELPATDVDTILRYFRAFLCLEDWLRARSEIDLTRRLTFFADPFPKHYVRQVVSTGYAPSIGRLIDDYLAANPTRNRSLDLLPLFAHLDEPRVRKVVDDALIKARPTLHYRLPNSHVGKAGWSLDAAWQDWLVVEHLAAQARSLSELCETYSSFLSRLVQRLTGDWSSVCDLWLRRNGFRDHDAPPP